MAWAVFVYAKVWHSADLYVPCHGVWRLSGHMSLLAAAYFATVMTHCITTRDKLSCLLVHTVDVQPVQGCTIGQLCVLLHI